MGSASAVRGEASTGIGIGPAWVGTNLPTRVATTLLGAATAVIVVAWQSTTTSPPTTAVAVIAVVALAGAAAVVDRSTYRIPNTLVSAAAAVLLLAALAESSPFATSGRLLIGALGAGLPLLIVRLHRGLGMGDVKLAAVLGATAGLVHPLAAPTALAIGAFAAGMTGLVARRQRLALGPSLWVGWAITLDAFALTTIAGGLGR